MNSKRIPVCALAIVLAALFAGCGKGEKESAKEGPGKEGAAKEGEKPEVSRVKTGTNGDVTVTVSVEEQKLMGLQTAQLTVTQMNSSIQAFGHVLDTTVLGPIMNDYLTAQVAAENSRQELERMKTLAAQTNASERAYQTAQAAYARDQLSAKAALIKIQGAWGSKLSQMMTSSPASSAGSDSQATLLNHLAALENVLVRIDVPAPQTLSSPKTALLLSSDSKSVAAQFVDVAPTTDSQLQARGLLFVANNEDRRFIPGMAVTAQVDTGQSSTNGVVVPRDAVLRAKGTTWVYVQTGETEFTRRETATEFPTASGWFLPGRFQGDEKVVTAGAQQLLSEELKGQIGE